MDVSRTVSDVELVKRARESENDFELFYRAYSPVVYAWFRRHASSNPAEAADLTAELFARCILSIRRFSGNRPGSGTAWVFAIARHLAANYLRDKRIEGRARARLRLPEISAPDPAEDADLRLSASQAHAEIVSAFEALTKQQREAIQLRVVDELAYSEIASRTGATSQATRLHVMRGLQRLRELLGHSE
jgi:RNA polymerase sigma-70 factor (ECF subfamily)